jgi:hypothetical protein
MKPGAFVDGVKLGVHLVKSLKQQAKRDAPEMYFQASTVF